MGLARSGMLRRCPILGLAAPAMTQPVSTWAWLTCSMPNSRGGSANNERVWRHPATALAVRPWCHVLLPCAHADEFAAVYRRQLWLPTVVGNAGGFTQGGATISYSSCPWVFQLGNPNPSSSTNYGYRLRIQRTSTQEVVEVVNVPGEVTSLICDSTQSNEFQRTSCGAWEQGMMLCHPLAHCMMMAWSDSRTVRCPATLRAMLMQRECCADASTGGPMASGPPAPQNFRNGAAHDIIVEYYLGAGNEIDVGLDLKVRTHYLSPATMVLTR
jgi:hypothetical protein